MLQPYTSYQVNLSGEARKGIFTANLWSSYEYRAKAIIDEIDDYICPLYGLTQEETDFIKNYELEFRLAGE